MISGEVLSIKNTLRNEYAWSPRGELVKDERKGRATEKLDIVAGLSGGSVVAPMMYECSIDSDLFNFWLEHQLLPEIPKNSLVVMDNASFHTSEKNEGTCEEIFLQAAFSAALFP
jgi:hypothetical protein